MPIKFMVALQVRSRFFRSSVGLFAYHPESGRQIWRGETTSDIARLAELVNEGLKFLQVQNLVDHVMEVVPAPDCVQSEQALTELGLSPEIEAQLTELNAKLAEVSAGIEAKDARIAELELQLAAATAKPEGLVHVSDAVKEAEESAGEHLPEAKPEDANFAPEGSTANAIPPIGESAPEEPTAAPTEAAEKPVEEIPTPTEAVPAAPPAKPEKPARKRKLLTK